jgi:prepilin-type N-terminal cleavage/methylation domain-containing protein
MPISETGNQTTGYTLLEVVAVITLIGLIMALVYPSINLSVERVEIGYIGRLIRADFNQIKDESILDPAQRMFVTFRKDGYFFMIGEHVITRSFNYQFTFALPEPKADENSQAPTATKTPESANPAKLFDKVMTTVDTVKTRTKDNQELKEEQHDDQGSSDDKTESPPDSYDLNIINGELTDENLQLKWQTTHFQGSLLCKKDETVVWNYGKK